MTIDEIKTNVRMNDVLEMYGMRSSRSGNISCPFHGTDRHPSMKIYPDGYKCFTCGATGDVIDFVMEMDRCSFKDAFLKLGGTYPKGETEFERKLRLYRIKAKKREIERQKRQDNLDRRNNLELIQTYQRWVDRLEPLSQAWTECYNALFYQLYIQEMRWGSEATRGNG